MIAVLVSLVPVTMGALTTTLDAGMAFNDWPTSDGHNMLTYPWFRSYGDKFIEHGHRLGGMLIGFVTLILVGVTMKVETRRWVKVAVFAVLLAVIAQGIAGGRSRSDERPNSGNDPRAVCSVGCRITGAPCVLDGEDVAEARAGFCSGTRVCCDALRGDSPNCHCDPIHAWWVPPTQTHGHA